MTDKKKPAVVDFSTGAYAFGFKGSTVIDSIYEKVKKLETETVLLLETLVREIGDKPKDIASLIVAMHSPTGNVKTRYLHSIVKRIIELEQERTELSRIARGMNNTMIYKLGTKELERFGL